MDWIRWIFLGPFGLRSGWRVAIWSVLFTFVTIVVSIAVVFGLGIRPDQDQGWLVVLGINAFALAPASLLTTWLVTWLVDRQPISTVGFGGSPGKVTTQVGVGTALGLSCVSAGVALLLAAGYVDLERRDDPIATVLGAAVLLLLAAAYEEIVFRGYCFHWLSRGIGFWPVALGTSLLFGLVHLGNDSVTVVSFLVIVGAGVLLAWSLRVSGAIWVPIGLHFGWNAAQGLLFGMPISGIPGVPSVSSSHLHGADVWTGGAFGLEGSLAAFVSLAVGFAGLAARRKTRDRITT